MDPRDVDRFVRGFGRSASRRRLLGGLLGGALLLPDPAASEAAKPALRPGNRSMPTPVRKASAAS